MSDHTNSLFGYSPDEIKEKANGFFEALLFPEDIARIIKEKNESILADRLFVLEYRIWTRTRNFKFVRDQYTCYQEEDGSWFMEGYISEISHGSDRESMYEQLKAYRHAVDVNMISSITDRAGKIVYVNDKFCEISQYSAEELIGKDHRIINSHHHPKEFFTDLWRTISSGQQWHGEILNKAKDGSFYWVDSVIIPIFDRSKQVVNYLSLRMLITDRKAAEEHRKEYIVLLERIAFMVAHEVRGPLCSILGLTNILLNYNISESESLKTVEYLKDSARKLDEITQKLSQFVYEHEIEIREKMHRLTTNDHLS